MKQYNNGVKGFVASTRYSVHFNLTRMYYHSILLVKEKENFNFRKGKESISPNHNDH